MKYTIDEAVNFKPDFIIDLEHYKDVEVRYSTCVYKINIKKFLEEFGNLIEVVYDSKVEE